MRGLSIEPLQSLFHRVMQVRFINDIHMSDFLIAYLYDPA